MIRAHFPRTVSLSRSFITWTDVGGWLVAAKKRAASSRSPHALNASLRLFRSLTIDDIRHCDDPNALSLLISWLSEQRAASSCATPHSVSAALSPVRLCELIGQAKQRLSMITAGRAYNARPFVRWPSDCRAGADDLRHLLQLHPELSQIDALDCELRRRELMQ